MSWDFRITCDVSPKFLLMEIHKNMVINFHWLKQLCKLRLKAIKIIEKYCNPSDSYFNFKKCFTSAMIICAQTHIYLCFWRSQEYSLVVLHRMEKRTHLQKKLLFMHS